MVAGGASVRLRLDDKRRTTLPPTLLAAAGVGPGADLVARVEAPGRIVLEDPAAILGRLQTAVRAGRTAHALSGEGIEGAEGNKGGAGAGGGAGRAHHVTVTDDVGLRDTTSASLADQLLAERAADTSLTGDGDGDGDDDDVGGENGDDVGNRRSGPEADREDSGPAAASSPGSPSPSSSPGPSSPVSA